MDYIREELLRQRTVLARLLLGQVSFAVGGASLLIVLITAAVLCLLAGKVYRMMSLYKGDPPTPQKLLAMLKEDK